MRPLLLFAFVLGVAFTFAAPTGPVGGKRNDV